MRFWGMVLLVAGVLLNAPGVAAASGSEIPEHLKGFYARTGALVAEGRGDEAYAMTLFDEAGRAEVFLTIPERAAWVGFFLDALNQAGRGERAAEILALERERYRAAILSHLRRLETLAAGLYRDGKPGQAKELNRLLQETIRDADWRAGEPGPLFEENRLPAPRVPAGTDPTWFPAVEAPR